MKTYLLTIVLVTYTLFIYSQGVGINDDGSMPVDGAILDVKSTSGGILIPRMTEAQRDAINPDTQSMLIYQTNNDSGFYYYDGTNWNPFLVGGNAANSGWSTTGNVGTDPTLHFIGTVDSTDWVIRTNNNEKVRITGNGNVGIGTALPSSKLHVSHPSVSALSSFYAGGSGAQFGAEASAATILSTNFINFYTGGAGFVADGSAPTANGATLKMTLTAAGNLGIGNSNPVSRLEIAPVDSNAAVRLHYPASTTNTLNYTNYQHNDLLFSNYLTAGASQHYLSFGYVGGVKRRFHLGSAGDGTFNGNTNFVPHLTIESDGNVGIGTTSPSTAFHVQRTTAGHHVTLENTDGTTADAYSGLRFLSGSRSGYLWVRNQNFSGGEGDGAFNVYAETGPLHLWSAGQQKMILNTDGYIRMPAGYTGNRLSIGFANTATGLSGTANEAGIHMYMLSNAVAFIDALTSGASATTLYLRTYNNGTYNNGVVIGNNGIVGINRVPTSNTLEVGGTASKTVAGAFIANSDKRLKKDIQPMNSDEILTKILNMQGVTYQWNDDKTGIERPKGIMTGFIAQDLQKIWPEKVNQDNLGYLQTAYGDYAPMFVESIKSLHNKIKEQEQIIEALKINSSVMKKEATEQFHQLKIENKKLTK